MKGHLPSERMNADEMEMGIGIHGEPGSFTAPIADADAIVDQLLKMVFDHVNEIAHTEPLDKGGRMSVNHAYVAARFHFPQNLPLVQVTVPLC